MSSLPGVEAMSSTVSNQSHSKVFELPREFVSLLEERMTAARVVSRKYRAAVFVLIAFLARQWSHPDRMNGCFACARESKRGRSVRRFYQDLGLTEWFFRRALEVLVELEVLECVGRDKSKWRWTAWGVRRKAYEYRFAGVWRQLLDDAWAERIEGGRMTPAQRLFRALQRRREQLAKQLLRNTELRSKGLSTIPEARVSVASRCAPPTAVSGFNRSAARDGSGVEEALRRWGLCFPGK